MMERTSGILLPVFSLPSSEGIGTLGRAAFEFVDFLRRAGQTWWQILPVGPAGVGDSPYSGASARAGNPLLIDLALLAEDGLLTPRELSALPEGGEAVDYAAVTAAKPPLLRLAFARGGPRDAEKLAAFTKENREWLPDYALFMAAKERFGGADWLSWPDEALRRREPEALERWRRELAEEIAFHTYVQYLFFTQWRALREYAGKRGVRIVGDMPIYVSLNSADVWAEPRFFRLDETGHPAAVAGVPPDYFCAEGQLWGNPLYDWESMKRDGYGWWIRRVGGAARLFDAVRIDHFRGFESYWAVPADARTAREGRWEKGPGMDLVGVLTSWFSGTQFIAEDLGLLTPAVEELLRASGLPGMRVLEFAFTGGADNAYLPHNFVRSCVCYTGTHDNAPVLGWWDGASAEERRAAETYLGVRGREGILPALLRAGLGSVADLFVAQMQDWLALGAQARTNTPGTSAGNWSWRLAPGRLTEELAGRIRQASAVYGRCRPEPELPIAD